MFITGGKMTEEIKDKSEEIIQEEDEETEPLEEKKEPGEIDSSEGAEESEEIQEMDVEALLAELEVQQQKSEEYLDGWQRERAEFTNYKKRMERERDLQRHNIKGNVIRGYLEILDDLELALKNRPTDDEGASWSEGIELVYRKFLALLEAEGVEPMQADGQQFDPNLHEAISQEPNDDFESGQVIEVVRNGYLIGERVLRPASVRVSQ
jgi:molecular chaperone GrpE